MKRSPCARFLPIEEDFPCSTDGAACAEKGCAVEYAELYDSFAIGGARLSRSPAPVSDPNSEYAAFGRRRTPPTIFPPSFIWNTKERAFC
ncbi:MAG: hypothetical protein ACLRSW_16635 [Christensenellaceae bacterium]